MRRNRFSEIGRDLTADVFNGKLYRTNRPVHTIVLHCSASSQGQGHDVDTIDQWHLEREWSGCGYHYVILEDGTIQKGRDTDQVGAHIKNHNTGSIGICRIGGGDGVRDATPEQDASINALIEILIDQYDLDKESVKGHNEFKGVYRGCPMYDMDSLRNSL